MAKRRSARAESSDSSSRSKTGLQVNAANIPDKMFPEIIPLPAVEIGAKALYKFHRVRRKVPFREGMKPVKDRQRL